MACLGRVVVPTVTRRTGEWRLGHRRQVCIRPGFDEVANFVLQCSMSAVQIWQEKREIRLFRQGFKYWQ